VKRWGLDDLSGTKRLPIDFTNEGRVAVLKYVKLHLAGSTVELDTVVLDTGLEVGALVPRSALGTHWSNVNSRPASICTLSGQVLRCEALVVVVMLGDESFLEELYVSDHAPTPILGLPLLRKFHLMLAEGDPSVPWGPSLLKPPLTQHGLTRAG
jgi:predicted aspartyl protease